METKEKQILWWVATIIILVAMVFFFSGDFSRDSNIPNGNSPDVTETSDEVRIEEQSAKESLDAFPDDFPVEEGVAGSSGYSYIPANSTEQQSTLEYTSSKSFVENDQTFRNYLVGNGYEIVNEESESGFNFYYATKDNNDLSITIEGADGKVTVSASYLSR